MCSTPSGFCLSRDLTTCARQRALFSAFGVPQKSASSRGRIFRSCQQAPSSAHARLCRARQISVCARAASDSNDPGHWNHSPEWWGTHAGGWGQDSGTTVFMQHSHCGNGEVTLGLQLASRTPSSKLCSTNVAAQVTVTAHAASLLHELKNPIEQQWRVLRFNDTRQSVSRVALHSDSHMPQAQADCLAFEYLKTMASAGLAFSITHSAAACLAV